MLGLKEKFFKIMIIENKLRILWFQSFNFHGFVLSIKVMRFDHDHNFVFIKGLVFFNATSYFFLGEPSKK